jgi:2-oxo-4-hydroxy-4-carboxy--5-ureidoimidazoline (OHCU) decarboxylase
VFLVAAAGRRADDILASLRERMTNDPATELEVAAEEQRKITRLRLLALLDR